MLNLVKQDAARWIVPGQIGDPSTITAKSLAFLLYRHHGLRAVAWFRFSGWLDDSPIRGAAAAVQRLLLRRYGFEIGGDIGGGLYVAHPAGTVIFVDRMGENCSVIASVTVGMRNEYAFPRIGDDVFIGAGARVLGDIDVADGAKVGANSVVLSDVPAGATVVGAPAKPIGTGVAGGALSAD